MSLSLLLISDINVKIFIIINSLFLKLQIHVLLFNCIVITYITIFI